MTHTLTVRADRGDHECRVTLPVREYYGTHGVWVRCSTCGEIHLCRKSEDAV